MTTVIAGITVPFTPLVQSAIEHVQAESPPWLFHHVMRSWLFAAKLAAAAAAAADKTESISIIDEETLAIASIFHDFGLVPKYSSTDRRFEVDSAAAAVSFIRSHAGTPTPDSADFYKHRLREVLVWDAIALHTTNSLSSHAPAEVDFCQRGIGIDFRGRGLDALPDAHATVAAVLEAFPRLGIKEEFKECLCGLARTKPQTTYDNWAAAFGAAYVEGYERPKEEDDALVLGLGRNPLDNWQ